LLVIDIIKRACELKNNFTVYCQAALSAFSVSKKDIYRKLSGHPESYMNLLLEERNQFEQLINKENILIKMILWPVRGYNKELLEIRYETLLEWMKDIINNQPKARVEFVCAEYVGQNRLIISNSPQYDMLFEGIKRKQTPGYEINILTRNKEKISKAISDFESVYQNACIKGLQGKGAITEIERIRDIHLK